MGSQPASQLHRSQNLVKPMQIHKFLANTYKSPSKSSVFKQNMAKHARIPINTNPKWQIPTFKIPKIPIIPMFWKSLDVLIDICHWCQNTNQDLQRLIKYWYYWYFGYFLYFYWYLSLGVGIYWYSFMFCYILRENHRFTMAFKSICRKLMDLVWFY